MRPAHYVVATVVAAAMAAALVFYLAWLTSGAVVSTKPHPALLLLAPMIAAVKLGLSKGVGLLLSFALYSAIFFVWLILNIRRGVVRNG